MFDFESRLSDRIKKLRPSGIRRFFDLVKEFPDAISLGVGEPDFITPWSIRDAAIKSIQKGYTQYTSNWGVLELREQISAFLESMFGLKYNPSNEILVTVGASEAIDLALRAIVSPGDEVLIPEPSYVSYHPCVTLCDGVPVPVKTELKDDFKLTPENLEKVITPKTKALILPFPNNPTGAYMNLEDLKKIAPIIIKHDLIVISDEIYGFLTYGADHVSIAALDGMRERTIVINGFSKAFAMTGWRLGFLAAPSEAVKHIIKIHQYVIMCAPTFSQYAAITALKGGAADNWADIIAMRQDYDKRRRLVVHRFNEMGLKCFEPRGAFYAFPNVEITGMDGDEFAERLLQEKRVAVIPGSVFGEFGKFHVRACYATALNSLIEALRRIEEFVKEHKK
ncbi:MAG TPA: aminotransferase class I/II-fold pyridoxal phosphate-dependent enzyme [Clostridia bacterium]